MIINDKIEAKVYKILCSYCPYSKQCHEECITCDEYNDMLQMEAEKNDD